MKRYLSVSTTREVVMKESTATERVLHLLSLAAGLLSLAAAVASAIWVLVSWSEPIAHGNRPAVVWSMVIMVLGVITLVAAWKRRPEVAWLAAFAFMFIGIGGIWTIGLVVGLVTAPVGLTAFLISCERILAWWRRTPGSSAPCGS